MTTKRIIVNCPSCKKELLWCDKEKHKPFCSERCKLIDLGEWAAEEKRIPGEPVYPETDFDDLLH